MNENITFKEAAGAWVDRDSKRLVKQTMNTRISILSVHLIPIFGEKKLKELTAEEINKTIKTELKDKKNLASSTIKNVAATLISLLNFAKEEYGLPAAAGIEANIDKPEKQSVRVLTNDEQSRLLNFLLAENDMRKISVAVMFYTGINHYEICAVKWSDVDLEKRCVTIPGDWRKVPLNSYITGVLKWTGEHISSNYFVSDAKRPLMERRQEILLNTYARELDIEGLTFPVIWNTFIANSIKCGCGVKMLSAMTGQSDNKILKVYDSISAEDGMNEAV